MASSKMQEPRVLAPLVGGVDVAREPLVPLRSPVDGAVLAHVGEATEADVVAAIQASRRHVLSAPEAAGSGEVLRKLRRCLELSADALVSAEVAATGRPTALVQADHEAALALLAFAAKQGDGAGVERLEVPRGAASLSAVPLGVVGAVVPPEAPLFDTVRFLSAAVVAGDSLVLAVDPCVMPVAALVAPLALEAGVLPDQLHLLPGAVAKDALARAPVDLFVAPDEPLASLALEVGAARDVSLEPASVTPYVMLADAALDETADLLVHGAFLGTADMRREGAVVLLPSLKSID